MKQTAFYLLLREDISLFSEIYFKKKIEYTV